MRKARRLIPKNRTQEVLKDLIAEVEVPQERSWRKEAQANKNAR